MTRSKISKSIALITACFVLSFGLVAEQSSIAQDLSQLTPEILQKLKTSTATGKPISRLSPVDQARQSAVIPTQKSGSASLSKDEMVLPSRVEEVYRLRSGDNMLTQYGYDIFEEKTYEDSSDFGYNPSLNTGQEQTLTGRVSGSYLLGIGDEVVVILTGSKENNYSTTVDQEGRVVLPEMGPILAAGKSFAAFEAELKSKVSKLFLGTEVYVSMGGLKTINVFVLGNVVNPGRYQLISMSTPLDALSLAGGIKKNGSLRAIKIIQDDCLAQNNCKSIDLYALTRNGEGVDFGLKDGARIIVPTIGATVAVVGEVLQPGIFELPKGVTSVRRSSVMNYAGGSIRPRGIRFGAQRINDDGREVLTEINSAGANVISGDILRVDSLSRGLSGHVTLVGEVQVRGQRSLATFNTISKLVNGESGLGENPYLPFAVIETADEKTRARNYKAFNLASVIAGAEDFSLVDKDKVFVLGEKEIKFLSSPALRVTILDKENLSQCRALNYLVDYMTLVGDNRFSAVTRGFAVAEKAQDEGAIEKKNIPENFTDSDNTKQSLTRDTSVSTNEYSKSRLIFDGGNVYPETCSPLFEKNQKLLPFILEYVVSVTGAVRNPGVYPLGSDVDLGSILSVAGGMSSNADMSQIEIVATNTNAGAVATTSRRYFDVRKTSMGNINVSSRMTVRVPQLITNEESSAVVLSGEFMRPGVYTISKGEKLSDLITRAGGLSEYAYPYGGVLTRISIARQEQEGYAQAAKHIETALTSASIKTKNISGGAIAAVQSFAFDLRNAKAIGRLVAELDPAVLTVQPTKDIILEGGDKIFIPKRPNHVLVSGDVLNPGALSFDPDRKVREYVKSAGGVTVSGDKKRVFVVYPNGEATPVNMSKWTYSGSPTIPPGSAIMIPIDLDPFTKLELAATITNLIGQMAITMASIAVIAR